MKKLITIISFIFIIGCASNQVEPTPESEPIPPASTVPEWRNDKETWEDNSIPGTVTIKGCEEWKLRNPEADC